MVRVLVVILIAACSNPGDPGKPGDMPDASVESPDAAASTPLRVFVTGAFLGTLYEPGGGLAAGDTKCTAAATTAGLGGAWRAWLSTTTVNAIDRVNGSGPWRLIDGTLVFETRAALANGPAHAIDQTANGDTLGGGPVPVWTGTTAAGKVASSTCLDWVTDRDTTGRAGRLGATGTAWTDADSLSCSVYAYLYCFEQP